MTTTAWEDSCDRCGRTFDTHAAAISHRVTCTATRKEPPPMPDTDTPPPSPEPTLPDPGKPPLRKPRTRKPPAEDTESADGIVVACDPPPSGVFTPDQTARVEALKIAATHVWVPYHSDQFAGELIRVARWLINGDDPDGPDTATEHLSFIPAPTHQEGTPQ